MFNLVIENEMNVDIDPLIIKEDINNIIQSIEEQLYNININYRNNVRKIKNNLKSLDGISESSLIILENEHINDDNLIPYLTNVLEISLDCIISTLYKDVQHRPQLKYVNNINDLLKIDSHNTSVFENILNESKELFNIYSQVNEVEISSTTFYELLDAVIESSILTNKKIIPFDIKQENTIYKEVLENLDNLVTNDLEVTYNNIKLFAASKVNEATGGTGPAAGAAAAGAAGAAAAGAAGAAAGAIRGINFTITGALFRSLGSYLGAMTLKKALNITLAGTGILALLKYFGTGSSAVGDYFKTNPDVRKLLLLLETDKTSNNLKPEEIKALVEYYSTANPDEKSIMTGLFAQTGIFNSVINPTAIAEKQKQVGVIQSTIDTLKVELSKLSDQISNKAKELKQELTGLTSQKEELNQELANLTTQKAVLTKAVDENDIRIAKQVEEISNNKAELTELLSQLNSVTNTVGGRVTIIVGLAMIGFIVYALFTRKKIFGTQQYSKTISTILSLRRQIDKIRKSTLSLFPDLRIQFDYLDSEVAKCERDATRRNDFVLTYECGIKYFMGSYAIVLYRTLIEMTKDGIAVNKFNKLSDVHNYNGFASYVTRNIIKELNTFYSNIITFDATLVEAFETVFNMVKQQIIENRFTDNISSRLPNRLTTTMIGKHNVPRIFN